MKNKLASRDEIAMSMPDEFMPKLQGEIAIQYMCKEFDLKWSEDLLDQINFSFSFSAIMQYKYADAMIKHRDNLNTQNEKN